MDKYTTIKVDEIQRLAEMKQYKEAIIILDSIDMRKIRAVSDLSIFAEILSKNERYEEAIDILLRVYDRSKTRRILSQLIYLTLKIRKYDTAEEYYDEYLEMAPKDDNRFILHYRIEKAKGAPYNELIDILEEFKENNYIEEWAYELAKLYHKAGYKEKCLEECNEIILWFGKGTVVEKANKLKNYYADMEKANLESRFAEEEIKKEADEENENWQEIIVDYSGLGIRGIEKFQEPGETENLHNETEENLTEFDLGSENQILIHNVDMDCIFKNYMNIEAVRAQLQSIFQTCFLNLEYTCKGFYITGYDKSGKTRLALMLSKACYRLGKISSSKVALITADKLNTIRDLSKLEKTLSGCCLVIVHASELEEKTIDGITNLMKQLEKKLIVFLEDGKEKLEELFQINEEWKQIFELGIHLPDYNKEDLIGFMKTNLKEEQYELDEEAEEIMKNVAGSTARRVDPFRRLPVMVERLEKAITYMEERGENNTPKRIQAEDFRIG